VRDAPLRYGNLHFDEVRGIAGGQGVALVPQAAIIPEFHNTEKAGEPIVEQDFLWLYQSAM
jgi:hypothetical protein